MTAHRYRVSLGAVGNVLELNSIRFKKKKLDIQKDIVIGPKSHSWLVAEPKL